MAGGPGPLRLPVGPACRAQPQADSTAGQGPSGVEALLGWAGRYGGPLAVEERELDDASLVEAAQGGDDDAFTELFRRHYPSVRRACARRLGSIGEADEVAQAAFVRAYERLDQCGGERRFGAWVQVIAYRLASDARRRQSRSFLTDDPAPGDAALGPNLCEEALLRAEEAAEVHEVLASLPPRQREVLIARDLEGRRPGEIAASLGLSLGAVDSLLLRARRRMATTWRTSRLQSGASSASVTTASAAATSAAAAAPDRLYRILDAAREVLARVSYRIATTSGVLPGGSPVQRLGGFAVAGLVAAGPAVAAMPLAAHAPTPPPTRPPIAVPASTVTVPPAPALTVPTLPPPPSTVATLPAPALNPAPAPAAPAPTLPNPVPSVTVPVAPSAAARVSVGGVVNGVSKTVAGVVHTLLP